MFKAQYSALKLFEIVTVIICLLHDSVLESNTQSLTGEAAGFSQDLWDHEIT